MQFAVGVIFLVASVLAFRLALPRDGEVRSFLRNDHLQAYYAVAVLGAFVVGFFNVILGLLAVIG